MDAPTVELASINEESERCFERGEIARAFELTDELIEKGSTTEYTAWAWVAKANMLSQLSRTKEAVSCGRKALELIDDLPNTKATREVAALAQISLALSSDDATEARTAAAAAIPLIDEMLRDVAERDERWHLSSLLGEMYETLGEEGKAIALHESVVAKSATDAERITALLKLGSALQGFGQLERCLSVLEEARGLLSRVPNMTPHILREIAVAQDAAGQTEKAVVSLHALLDQMQKNPLANANQAFQADAHWRLAIDYYLLENYPEAGKHAAKAVECAEGDMFWWAGGHLILGHIALAEGRFDDARRHYIGALRSEKLRDPEIEEAKGGLELVNQYQAN